MKTPEQLKGAIRNFASKNNLRALDVQHMFLFERILERLAYRLMQRILSSKAVC